MKPALLFIIVPILLLAAVVFGAYQIVGKNHQYATDSIAELRQNVGSTQPAIIVLGSGVTEDGQPRNALTKRLNAAQALYEAGISKRVIVSGYVSTAEQYNEPAAMERYLSERGVAAAHIEQDGGGYDTFATCTNAQNAFSVDVAVVVTQPSHVDRTIYLCRSLGIETYGFAAEPYSSQAQGTQSVREALSNVKAVTDVLLQ